MANFEVASANSISYSYLGKDINKIPLHNHQTWRRSDGKERMGVYRTEFSDGSSITCVYTYESNDMPYDIKKPEQVCKWIPYKSDQRLSGIKWPGPKGKDKL